MSVREIIRSFDAWRAAATPLVLATVYETLGSTYSKAGHRILIAANGDYRGLVSGGCLEGDLAERARAALAADRPAAVTYDLRDEADEIFGVGGPAAARLAERARGTLASGAAELATDEGATALLAPLKPIPRLLVLGAGLDAVPLVAMAAELGWFVTVADHRPAYVERGGF